MRERQESHYFSKESGMKVCSAAARRALSILGMLALVLASTTLSSPGVIAQEPASPAGEASTGSGADELPPLPLSPIETAQRDGTALPLSLKDLTKLALEQNLDIAISDTNEQLRQQAILQQHGSYDPQLTAQVGFNSRKNANTTQYDRSTESFNKNDNAQWNFTFRQPVKTGGTLQATWNSSRSESNSTAMVFNPNYQSSWSVQFSQPLWRNLRIDSNRANLKLANLDLTLTDSEFKQKVTDTISNIQTAYWDLVSAIRNYEIRRNSVKLAQINLRDSRKKVEVGTSAPIDVTDAEATAASREVDLISAEETILRAQNTLRSLVSNDRNADIWRKVIVPTDQPDFKEFKVDVETAINTALQNRPELRQADLNLQQLDIRKRLNQNNRKWQFDLTGQFGGTGTAGPQGCQKNQFTGECVLDGSGNPILLTPPALVGGIGNAYKTMWTEGYTNWQLQLQVTIPLRNRSIDAQIAQQNIQKRQQLMNIRKTEQSIQVEIRNALQALETNRKQVETSGVARRLAQERLEGEEKRFQAGLSQNYLVLQRQNELSTAEYQELQSLIRYKQAVVTVQKAMYTLLESNDFEIAKGSSANVPNLKSCFRGRRGEPRFPPAAQFLFPPPPAPLESAHADRDRRLYPAGPRRGELFERLHLPHPAGKIDRLPRFRLSRLRPPGAPLGQHPGALGSAPRGEMPRRPPPDPGPLPGGRTPDGPRLFHLDPHLGPFLPHPGQFPPARGRHRPGLHRLRPPRPAQQDHPPRDGGRDRAEPVAGARILHGRGFRGRRLPFRGRRACRPPLDRVGAGGRHRRGAPAGRRFRL
jgi:HAE1 family hydrophobic/amphiphilic exporter-1